MFKYNMDVMSEHARIESLLFAEIQRLIEKGTLKQNKLAKDAGISTGHLSALLKKKKRLHPQTLLDLLAALDLELSDLLADNPMRDIVKDITPEESRMVTKLLTILRRSDIQVKNNLKSSLDLFYAALPSKKKRKTG